MMPAPSSFRCASVSSLGSAGPSPRMQHAPAEIGDRELLVHLVPHVEHRVLRSAGGRVVLEAPLVAGEEAEDLHVLILGVRAVRLEGEYLLAHTADAEVVVADLADCVGRALLDARHADDGAEAAEAEANAGVQLARAMQPVHGLVAVVVAKDGV